MIDYHCHILPGVDDGSKTREDSLEMARQLACAGFWRVVCTPHCITGLFDVSVQQIYAYVAELQRAIDDSGTELLLEPGMEYYLDAFFFDRLQNPVTLGNSNLLLFELPSAGNVELLPRAVSSILRQGLIPVLAHPERYFAFNQRIGRTGLASRLCRSLWTQHEVALPPRLLEAVDMGCRLQADLGSFNGVYGNQVRKVAFQLQNNDLYSFYGSDGHNPEQLRNILKDNNALRVFKTSLDRCGGEPQGSIPVER